MGFFSSLFKPKVQPEEHYVVTVSDEFVTVEHPKLGKESIKWKDIHTVSLINTDQGPWLPDIWLTLIGDTSRCMIPHESKGFDEVYEVVSKYTGFDFEKFTESMSCTNNAEFLLWTSKPDLASVNKN